MKKIFYTMIALAFISCLPMLAIEEAIELDTTEELPSNKLLLFGDVKEREIYSYSNYAESIESTGASVDIISRKDIEKQGTSSITELLNQTGSLFTQTSNGSEGAISTVRLRGTDRVRMTIDGIRADRTSTTMPGVESQFLLSDDIERVEIIRGPQGNLSGTNASGGLIAMQTRRGRGPLSIEMGSEMGNLGTFKERFAVMGGDHSLDYYMGVTWFKTDGGMKTSNLGRIHNDDFNNLNVVTNIGKRLLDERAEVRNIFRFSRARKGNGVGTHSISGLNYQDPNNYSLNYDFMNVTSFTHNPTEKYNYDTRFGIYHNENNNYLNPDNINDDPTFMSLAKIKSTRLNLMTQHNYKLASWNTLSVGYNLESEFIDGIGRDNGIWTGPLSYGYSGNTLQNDIYINDSINIKDKLFIRGGSRLIHNSDFGTYVTPNVSAALVLPTFKIKGAKTKFRSSFGQSVNNPTLYQRFGYMDMGYFKSIGNPNLDAEKLTGWDVGVTQSFWNEKLSLDFGYFNNDYKDYISYQYINSYTEGQYQNIDRAKIQGYEAKLTWEPKEWIKFVTSYTYTDSEDKTTHTDLVNCPKNSIKGMIYWTPNDIVNLFAGIEANSGRFMPPSNGETLKTDSYVDVKLGGKIRLLKTENTEIALTGTIYNLLDQDISHFKQNNWSSGVVTYYAPGINFRAGLSMKYTLPELKKKKKSQENETL